MYTPLFLIKFYSKKFRDKKYRDIISGLEKARLKITPIKFLAMSTFYSLLAFIPGAIIGYTVAKILFFDDFKIAALTAIFAVLALFLTKYLILSYPFYLAHSRAKKIDLYLPHAINTMLGMMRGGMQVYETIKFVAVNKHLFSELSTEFEKVVTLVEYGKDVSSALRYVAETTPSEKLRTFLDNLVNIYESSGNVLDYLKSKSEQFLAEKEVTYSALIEKLQVFSEVYLAIFIVFPLFLLIVLIVFQMTGQETLQIYRIFLFSTVPVGSLVVLFFLRTVMPSEKIGRLEKYGIPTVTAIVERAPEFKVSKKKRLVKKVKSFLMEPFNREVYELKLRSLLFYILLPPSIYFYIFHDRLEFDLTLFFMSLMVFIPLIFFIEYKEYLIRRIEEELPSLFKQMESMNRAGLNVVEILKNVSEAETSLLNREIKIVRRKVEWGEILTEAFRKLEERITSSILSRSVSMFVKSVESTSQIGDALATSASYSEMEVLMKKKVRKVMVVYVLIVYLAFAVFLYTTYVLINNIILIAPREAIKIDVFEIKRVFLETTLLIGFFSGVIIGVVGEGKLEACLKHIFIIMVSVYVVFKFFIY